MNYFGQKVWKYWVERFKMVTLMKGTNKPKLFIIGRLNLKNKAKKWFKQLHATHVDWWAMKVGMLLKVQDYW